MNKKEIAEIKKQYKPEYSCMSKIAGCYVDKDKNKVLSFNVPFLSLPEEEMFKYFDIFKNSLSGKLGDKLFNLSFPLAQEAAGGTQECFYKLLNSKMDDGLLDGFYDKFIDTYDNPESYLILVAEGMYDIPGKGLDDEIMPDASDDVYHFLHMCFCPAKFDKPELCYDPEKVCISDKKKGWVIGKPDNGILYPAFNDRNTDIHAALYYGRSCKCMHRDFAQELTGCLLSLNSEEQLNSFKAMAEKLNCTYDQAEKIQTALYDIAEANADNVMPASVNKKEMVDLLMDCGISDTEEAEDVFDSTVGEDGVIVLDNVLPKKVLIETAGVSIKVDPERAQVVKRKEIDGREYLVIPIETGTEVSGISVKNYK